MVGFKTFLNETLSFNDVVKKLKIKNSLNDYSSFEKIYNHYMSKLEAINKIATKIDNLHKKTDIELFRSFEDNINTLHASLREYKYKLKEKDAKLIFDDLGNLYSEISNSMRKLIVKHSVLDIA